MTNKKTIQLAVVVLIGFNLWVWYSLLGAHNAQNAIYFLNVGQGDSQLVTLASDRGMLPIKTLIDGGRDKKVLDALDTALGSANSKYIDIVVMSNPDLDHFGGFIDIARRYEVGLFVSTGYQSQTEAFRALQEEITAHNIPMLVLREGDHIRYQDNNLIVISPDRALMENKNLNEASMVMILKAGKSRALFTGDIGFLAESALRAKGYDLGADVLKVGHHGSKYSSDENFIAAVQPSVSVIGVGQNRYGHPAPRVLETLALAGSKIYRTDRDGTVKIILDKGGGVVSVSTKTAERIASLIELMTSGYEHRGLTTLALSEVQKETSVSRLVPYTRCTFRSENRPSHTPVIINEVAWMGSAQGFTHEWIELRNVSGGTTDISGWQIINENEKIHITFPQQSIFDPFDKLRENKQFIVLARNVANDARKLDADIIFTGAIRNSNEGLRFFDNNCALVDEVLAFPSWPAGDNKTKQTMERRDDLGWTNSTSFGGTPGKENSR